MACSSKTTGQVKTECNLGLWESGTHIWGYFDLVVFAILGSFGACNSKTTGHRAKWTEIGDSGTLVVDIWGTFYCRYMGYLLLFRDVLGSFGVLVSRLVVKQNGLEFGTYQHL